MNMVSFTRFMKAGLTKSSIHKRSIRNGVLIVLIYFLINGCKQCNWTIIDLYDRSVVASITDHNITTDLACKILQNAI